MFVIDGMYKIWMTCMWILFLLLKTGSKVQSDEVACDALGCTEIVFDRVFTEVNDFDRKHFREDTGGNHD